MKIDASSIISIKPELAEKLKNLKIGDTLKGRVLEALGTSIAIKTASGRLFTAVLMNGVKLQKGDIAELMVRSIADGKIYAELKAETITDDIDTKVTGLLRQIGLAAEDKNIEAAKLLIKYNLPVSKEVINNITGLQKSIDNLNQSSEGRAALLFSGLDIKNTPADVLNKIVLSWTPESINAEVLESTTRSAEIARGDSWGQGKSEVSDEIIKMTSEPDKSNNAASSKVVENIPKETAAAANKEPVKEIIIPEASESSKGAEMVRALEKLQIEAGNDVKDLAAKITDILNSIRGTDMEALAYLASKELKATPKNLEQLLSNIKNKDDISKFLNKLQTRLDELSGPELKEIKDSIKKIFLEPRQVEDSDKVTDQLKDIAKLGEKLESYLRSSGNKDPEIRDALSNLRDDIDFIISINEHGNYMQLPLLINGNTAAAKLYVFKEGKRGKAINPEDATILVALDLMNIGHVESLVGVKGKSVNVTFRVENKTIGTLIEKYSLSLKGALLNKGYSLNPIKVIYLEQPFSLFTLEAMMNENNSEKIHFDMRI